MTGPRPGWQSRFELSTSRSHIGTEQHVTDRQNARCQRDALVRLTRVRSGYTLRARFGSQAPIGVYGQSRALEVCHAAVVDFVVHPYNI